MGRDKDMNSYTKGIAGATHTPTSPHGGVNTHGATGKRPTCSASGHTMPNP